MLTELARRCSALRSALLPIVMTMLTMLTWVLTAGGHLPLLHLHFHVHLPSRAGGDSPWLLPALLLVLLSHPCVFTRLSCEC